MMTFLRRSRRSPSVGSQPLAGLLPASALVAACLSVVLPLRAQSPAMAATAATAAQRRAADSVFARFASTSSPGCLVGVNQSGMPLLRAAYGMADLERGIALREGMVAEIGSVSKQFVAATLVLLEQQGKLRLDDPVSRYLPEFPAFADAGGPITVRQLLQHTSGLRDQYTLLELVGRPYGEVVHTNAEVLRLISRQRHLNFPVNSGYLYSNTGYTLSALIAERVSGESLQALTERLLFAPLGMTQATWRSDFRVVVPQRVVPYEWSGAGWRLDHPFSALHGAGGLLTTIDEMITWTAALHAGRVGDDSTLATMTRVGVLSDGSRTAYGLGLMVREWRGVHEVAHSGSTAGYRAYLARYPAQDLIVAMQCNAGNADYVVLGRALAAVFLGEALQPAPPAPSAAVAPAAPRAAAMPGASYRALVGTWADAETGGSLRIALADSGIVVTMPAGREIPMRGITSDSLAGGGLAVALQRDRRGGVVGMRLDAGRVLGVRLTKRD